MVVPITFRGTGEKAIATYDYADVAEGTGIVILNAFETQNGGHVLSKESIYSSTIEMTDVKSSTTWVNVFDTDFDLPAFNAPQNIGGTGMVGFGYAFDGTGPSYAIITFTLKKYSNSVETDIGSCSYTRSNEADEKKATNMSMSITPTHFKKGDVLRLTALGEVKSDGAGAVRFTIGIDPMNRDGGYLIPSTDSPTTTTQLKVYVPFRIGL